MERRIEKFLAERKSEDLFRSLTRVSGHNRGKITVGEKEYINFSSNDYLGLASHPRLRDAAAKALDSGVGSSASRLMTGSTSHHHLLEKKTAEFKNKEAALVFNSGYQANVGVISALFGKDDCIFSDRFNHASIVDGARLSGAKLLRFRHNDVRHLGSLLKDERAKHKKALIVTETVFSMDGDMAPVDEIIKLKEKYDCVFMADEAHSTGVFGEDGSGVISGKALSGSVDIIMGTFSKALGGFGAYVASSGLVADYLVNTCRSFIYSTSLPLPVIAADIAALDVLREEPYRRRELLSNADYLRGKLKDRGFDVRGESQIIPAIIGDTEKTIDISEFLKSKGYWVTPVRPPTVPRNGSRLRISISYDHDRSILDEFIEDIAAYG
ncbi:MAG: 8-amino-7-oxononanoate synthase [Candidatus Omnitrophica bacterium]|nr:8-amino-7-oxononanoate synthase [Candidatus Omnitrophota bacterium]